MNPKEEAREIRRMATQIYCAFITGRPYDLKLPPMTFAYRAAVKVFEEFTKLETERYAEREKGEG